MVGLCAGSRGQPAQPFLSWTRMMNAAGLRQCGEEKERTWSTKASPGILVLNSQPLPSARSDKSSP